MRIIPHTWGKLAGDLGASHVLAEGYDWSSAGDLGSLAGTRNGCTLLEPLIGSEQVVLLNGVQSSRCDAMLNDQLAVHTHTDNSQVDSNMECLT